MKLPGIEHKYLHPVFDSTRWQGFQSRSDDILICTSYKAGTTWTQMICSLLIFRSAEFSQPLTAISPWLDLKIEPIEDVLATYEAQRHRRFIKTHTPLDGLPYYPEATYLYVGRDPRDVFMSMMNHLQNDNPEASRKFFDKQDYAILPEDPNELFKMWISTQRFPWESDGFPYWSHFHHAATYWRFRHLPNLHLFHYSDLQRDLTGEMKRLAGILNLDFEDAEINQLAHAASFDEMKSRADQLAPDVTHNMWLDNAKFFNKGTSGQWRGVLSDENLALYEAKKSTQPDGLGEWLEKGSAGGAGS